MIAVTGYEIAPCRYSDAARLTVEVCAPSAAEFWTLYAEHTEGEVTVADALSDHATFAEAWDAYRLTVGVNRAPSWSVPAGKRYQRLGA